MSKSKKTTKVKNSYYVAGPLALIAFIIFDAVGGLNYPGYNWFTNPVGDLKSINSYDFILSIILCAIYVVLTIFAVWCVWKFIKSKKYNKTLSRGLKLFLITALIAAIGSVAFIQTETGNLGKIKENAQLSFATETGDVDESTGTASETQVFDADATAQNFQNLGESLTNPMLTANLVCTLAVAVLSVLSLIWIIIGAFKKKGIVIFGSIAIFCLVFILYSFFGTMLMDETMYGINTRFATYSIILFLAFLSSFVYVTNVEE